MICPELVDKTYSTTFLLQIQQHSPSLLLDSAQCFSKLLTAIAPQRAECISGEAFRMDTAEHRLVSRDIPLDKGHMLVPVDFVDVAVYPESTVFRRQFRICHSLHN